MSTAERMKIMDYLPPEEQQKVLNLVIRLKEESEAKQKYISLYNSAQSAIEELTRKYNKLKDQNQYLKQQVHKSFEIVSEVRKNFRADKLRNSCEGKQKNEEEEYESQEEEENQENKQITSNQTLIQRLPKPVAKSPLEKYRPPMTSSKKVHTLNFSSNDLNKTHLSGSKSKQIEDLRREVRALHQGKKLKESKQKQLKEKRRLVDEIKSRYRGDEQESGEQMSNFKESTIQRIDISDAFDNEEHQTFVQKQKEKTNRIKSSEKNSQPKRMVQQRNQSKGQEAKPKPQGQKGHVVTSNDYGDVLEMINCYNL